MANISFHHQNSPVHSTAAKMMASTHHFQPSHHLFESSASSVSSGSAAIHHSSLNKSSSSPIGSVVRTINLSGQTSTTSNVSLVYENANSTSKQLFAKRIINGQGSLPTCTMVSTNGNRVNNNNGSNVITLSHIKSASAATPISNNVLIIKTEPGNGNLACGNGLIDVSAAGGQLASGRKFVSQNCSIKFHDSKTNSCQQQQADNKSPKQQSQPIIIYSKVNSGGTNVKCSTVNSNLLSAPSLPTSTLTSSTVVNGANSNNNSNKKLKKQTTVKASKLHLTNGKTSPSVSMESIHTLVSGTNGLTDVFATSNINGGFGSNNNSQNKPFTLLTSAISTTATAAANKMIGSKLMCSSSSLSSASSLSLSSFTSCLKSNIENCLPTESNKMIFSIASVSPHLPDDIFDSDDEEEEEQDNYDDHHHHHQMQTIINKKPPDAIKLETLEQESKVEEKKFVPIENVKSEVTEHSTNEPTTTVRTEVKNELDDEEVVILGGDDDKHKQPTQQIVRISKDSLKQLTSNQGGDTQPQNGITRLSSIGGSTIAAGLQCNFRTNDITFRSSRESPSSLSSSSSSVGLTSSTPVKSINLEPASNTQQQSSATLNHHTPSLIAPSPPLTSSVTSASVTLTSKANELALQFSPHSSLVTSLTNTSTATVATCATSKTTTSTTNGNEIRLHSVQPSSVKHVIAHVVKPSAVASLVSSANIVKVIKKSTISTSLSSVPSATVSSNLSSRSPRSTTSSSSHNQPQSSTKSNNSVNARRRREAFIQRRKQIWISLLKEIVPRRERLLSRAQEIRAKRKLLATHCRLHLLGGGGGTTTKVMTTPATTTNLATIVKPSPKRNRSKPNSGLVSAKKAKTSASSDLGAISTSSIISHPVGSSSSVPSNLSTSIKVTVIPNTLVGGGNLITAKRKTTK